MAAPELDVRFVSPEEFDRVWPSLEPLLGAACQSNEISRGELSPALLRREVLAGRASALVGYEYFLPVGVMVFELSSVGEHRVARILALAGKRLLAFGGGYWDSVLATLRGMGISYVDACANERVAEVYKNRFGFSDTCVYLRRKL